MPILSGVALDLFGPSTAPINLYGWPPALTSINLLRPSTTNTVTV